MNQFFIPELHNQCAGIFKRNDDAVLYIMSPRRIADQHHRSLLYNFTPELKTVAQEAIDNVVRGKASVAGATNYMLNTGVGGMCVAPSLTPDYAIGMGDMSMKFTFILIVNKFKAMARNSLSSLMQTTQGVEQSGIYYGWFDFEPIDPMQIYMPNPTPNRHAIMHFTHRTLLNKSVHDPYSYTSGRLDVAADEHLYEGQVNPRFVVGADGNDVRLLTPDALASDMPVVHNEDGTAQVYDTANDFNKLSLVGVTEFRTSWQNPATHTQDVMRRLISAAHTTNAQREGVALYPSAGQFGLSTRDNLGDTIRDAFSYASPFTNLNGLGGSHMTFGELLSRLNPIVEVIPPKVGGIEVTDQREQHQSVIWSTLLAQAIPPIASVYGIGTINFRYDSYAAERDGYHDPRVGWTIEYVDYLAILTPEQQGLKLSGFISEANRLWAQIQKINHFTVMGTFAPTVTHAILNFQDTVYKYTTPVEVPNQFGGLVSNLVGSSVAAADNAASFSDLINTALGGSERQTPPPFTIPQQPAQYNPGMSAPQFQPHQPTMLQHPQAPGMPAQGFFIPNIG